jgi:HPt (histidine-containing phosphotransfer) domain-containing protein
MDGYLSKPIHTEELDEILEDYLGRKLQMRAIPEDNPAVEDCVSSHELLERIDDDRNFLAELLELFRGAYPVQMSKGREAVANDDAAGLERVAHALKGALKNLSAPKASRLAQELEDMGKSGTTTDAGGKLTELEEELGRVVEQLQSLCPEMVP